MCYDLGVLILCFMGVRVLVPIYDCVDKYSYDLGVVFCY